MNFLIHKVIQFPSGQQDSTEIKFSSDEKKNQFSQETLNNS